MLAIFSKHLNKFLFILKLQIIMPHLDYAYIIYNKPNNLFYNKTKNFQNFSKNYGLNQLVMDYGIRNLFFLIILSITYHQHILLLTWATTLHLSFITFYNLHDITLYQNTFRTMFKTKNFKNTFTFYPYLISEWSNLDAKIKKSETFRWIQSSDHEVYKTRYALYFQYTWPNRHKTLNKTSSGL